MYSLSVHTSQREKPCLMAIMMTWMMTIMMQCVMLSNYVNVDGNYDDVDDDDDDAVCYAF